VTPECEKTKSTLDIIAAAAVDIKEDRRVSVRNLATTNGVSYWTINDILYDDLGLAISF
jgi:hypothetical protein